MLADFGVLKKILREICGTLDHGSLNNLPVFENDPSAERIARYIYGEAERRFPEEGLDPALLDAVEVYETPLTVARYEKRGGG
jgi:6-pyruvoyltetrahydropterin/6-carboxytetrahydropterin synthase